jgi:hypothetical protein
MDTTAGVNRAPYLMTVHARVCRCRQAPKELGRARTIERAEAAIGGYWNVYLGFFGDQVVWLNFQIVDLRDGQVVWRNGRRTRTEERTLDG